MTKRSFLPLLLLLPLVTLASAADLPSGEELLKRSIEKSGGAEALKKIKSTFMTGTMNLPAQNISGALKVYSAGERNYTVVDLPGIGKVEEGSDGETAWEISILQGARIKEGAEKTAMRNASSVAMLSQFEERFSSLKTLGMEDVEGKPAYKVEATPKEGKPMTLFFDKESMMIVKISLIAPSPMGEIPAETLVSDYKMVDGVMTPFTMTQKVMTASIITHFDSVKYNSELPKDIFALPAQIKAIVDKKKAQ